MLFQSITIGSLDIPPSFTVSTTTKHLVISEPSLSNLELQLFSHGYSHIFAISYLETSLKLNSFSLESLRWQGFNWAPRAGNLLQAKSVYYAPPVL